ncbi:MAG: 50S ribosomal protein L6 [Candidatus Omnitrophota bacterium]|nr:50S ribosomal protein L6 [Candidatus Omnitrophota bacterium]
MSRIGKKPLVIPKEAKVEIKDGIINVEGPKGKLSREFSNRLTVEIKDGSIFVKRSTDTKIDKSLHGLWRALISNMLTGVTVGYTKNLEIVGVGFKAQMQGQVLNMHLGFSHQVNFPIPDGIKAETPKPNLINLASINKELIGRIAMEIRRIYPPEPYKGKGIRFAGEYIKKKIGKAQAASAK